MEIDLTPQQIAALRAIPGHEVPVMNGASSERFYLLSEPSFLHLKGLGEGSEAWCHEQLRQLIQEGIESPEISAAAAFDRLRATAEKLAQDQA